MCWAVVVLMVDGTSRRAVFDNIDEAHSVALAVERLRLDVVVVVIELAGSDDDAR